MLQWDENLTYKTPPGRNVASTSRISFPKLGRVIFEYASTCTLGCSKCSEYFREYHYKNRDKKKEQRKLNRQKNIEHDKAYRQGYYQNNRDKTNEKKKKYNKDYKQLEVFCDDCQCNVKKYRWSRHLQTEKHKQNETVKHDEAEKLNKMTDEEKDELYKIKKLKQIWKSVWLKS